VVDLWNEILPDDFIQRPRMSRIYYEGKFYSYPLRAFEALFNLGIVRSTLCMASYAKAKAAAEHAGCAASKTGRSTSSGWKLYSIFFKNLYREGMGDAVRRNVGGLGRRSASRGLELGAAVLDGLKRSLGLNKKPNDGMETKTLLETFRYPRLGPGHDVGCGARFRCRQGQQRADGAQLQAAGAGCRSVATGGMSATKADGDVGDRPRST
jgi:hypothetical protein